MAHTYDDEQIAMNGVYPPTPEKETPTPKTVEDVVGEWDELIKVATKFELRTWLRTTLLAQNQAADERLREVFGELEQIMKLDIGDTSPTRLALQKFLTAKHGITNL